MRLGVRCEPLQPTVGWWQPRTESPGQRAVSAQDGVWGSATSPSPRRALPARPGSDVSSAACWFFLLMRSHNLLVSMLFFFLISGINSIKTVLSVFIMPGFVRIVN